ITAHPDGTNPVSAVLNGNEVTITGSPDSDQVTANRNTSNVIVVRSNGQVIGAFDAATVDTIQFNGFGGHGPFIVNPPVLATVLANGGAGHDTLVGGGGNNILIGGPGNDTLVGGKSRDILIGGTGRDTLIGSANQNILIGGSTAFDEDSNSLLQIMGVWS